MASRFGGGLVGAMLAGAIALAPAEVLAGEQWQLDAESGDWLLVDEPDGDAGRPQETWRPSDAAAAKEPGPVRSGGAIAGGVILTTLGAPLVALGGLGLFWEAGRQEDDPAAYVAPIRVTVLGLAAIGGGVALMVWGGPAAALGARRRVDLEPSRRPSPPRDRRGDRGDQAAPRQEVVSAHR